MNLKSKIHGTEFPAVQGVTFSEEYNETLDSGSLIVTHVSKIKKLRPFDDVYIYDNEFNGFDENGVVNGNNSFYKHMLVQNFTEEILNLKDKIYKYKISLMSEIKALEKVQLPNISVTQPLKAKYKVSVYEYLVRFVNLYSPKYKVVSDSTSKKWIYKNKYTVDPKLITVFGDVYPPDFTLNLPTLRDLLSKLMIVKDMIPYVENNVIKAMDITARKKEFVLDEKHMNYITGTMNSEDYCTGLRRTYSDALSQDSTCRSVEYIGFRNSNNSLMTIENMSLETRFPIYKINKMYMCYYKKANIATMDSNGDKKEYYFLCKQDITPLVKLNTERNVLSQDWDDFHVHYRIMTTEELAKYKMCTVGYDIGSKTISGWGTKYKYPTGWWDKQKTYIENIAYRLDSMYEYGIENYQFFVDSLKSYGFSEEDITLNSNGGFFESIVSPFTNKTLDLKSMIFIIDYQGFYNGSIITAKDNMEDDEIVSNDNSSSSLALLELDGLSQKEKANRFGNKTIQISARYESFDQLQELGDVYNNEDDTDVIIYHREYSIYDNMINCIYFGVKDYVLKNYYTSVFARHRTWNLIPYTESVRRSENRKIYLSLAKNKVYYENDNEFNFTSFENNNVSKLLLSAFLPSKIDETGVFKDDLKINFGYIVHNSKYFLSEVNSFLNGYSLCFNISMVDNISMGNFIKNPSPFDDNTELPDTSDSWAELGFEWFDAHNDFTGSVQDWYSIVDDIETGYSQKLGFYLAHQEKNNNVFDYGLFDNEQNIYSAYENYLFLLPKVDKIGDLTNRIGNEIEIYKDNKEFIDMTYQIEPICLDNDVLFSSWLMKLNDLLSNYHKIDNYGTINYTIPGDFSDKQNESSIETSLFCANYIPTNVIEPEESWSGITPYIVLGIRKVVADPIEELQNVLANKINVVGEKLECVYYYPDSQSSDSITPIIPDGSSTTEVPHKSLVVYKLNVLEIISIDYSSVTVKCLQTIGVLNGTGVVQEEFIEYSEDVVKLTLNAITDNSDDSRVYYYTRISKIVGKNFSPDSAFDYVTYTDTNNEIHLTNGKENKTTLTPPNIEPPSEMYLEILGEVTWGENYSYKISKNMFNILSKQSLKSTLVYNEYYEDDIRENDSYIIADNNVQDVFYVEKDSQNKEYINVNLENVKKQGFLFKDIVLAQPYEFEASSTDDSYEPIYIHCEFTTKDGTSYNKIELEYDTVNGIRMYFTENKTRDSRLVYGEYVGWLDEKYRKIRKDITLIELKNTSEIIEKFNQWKENNLVEDILDLSEINSIQYWYKDNREESFEEFEFYYTGLNHEPYLVKDFPVNIRATFKDLDNVNYVQIRLSLDLETGFKIEYEKLLKFGSSELITVYEDGKWVSNKFRTISHIVLNENHTGNETTLEQLNEWLSKNSTRYFDRNLMKFVFGVNISEQDKTNGYVKIYTSLISNRNPNVYDENYNIVGKVHNYANNEDFTYGVDQYYDEESVD